MRRLSVLLTITVLLLITSCGTSHDNKMLAESQYKLGLSHLQTGGAQQAFVKFHEALVYDPNNKEIHNALGNTNIMLGDYSAAETSFHNAIKLDRDYSEAWNNICYLYFKKLKEYGKAIDACENALKNPLYETPEKPLYNLGRIYYRLKNFKKSLENTEKALKRYPSLFQAFYSKALAYNALGRYSEAAEALSTAIDLDPRFQGNKQMAEKNFRENRHRYEDPREVDQLIEILHY